MIKSCSGRSGKLAKSEIGKKLNKAIEATEKFVDGLKKLQELGGEFIEALTDLRGKTEDKPEK
jgi:hypothetical protein